MTKFPIFEANRTSKQTEKQRLLLYIFKTKKEEAVEVGAAGLERAAYKNRLFISAILVLY